MSNANNELMKIHPDWYAIRRFDKDGYGLRVYLYCQRRDRNHWRIAVKPKSMRFDNFRETTGFVDETYTSLPKAIQAAQALANAMGLLGKDIRDQDLYDFL